MEIKSGPIWRRFYWGMTSFFLLAGCCTLPLAASVAYESRWPSVGTPRENDDGQQLSPALAAPLQSSGMNAMRQLVAEGKWEIIKTNLFSRDLFTSMNTALELGAIREPAVVPVLEPVILAEQMNRTLRKEAAKALAGTSLGARRLIQLAKDGKLPEDIRFFTALELSGILDSRLRSEAGKILPLPLLQGDTEFPSIDRLMKTTGDPEHGKSVFDRQESGCLRCHSVYRQGVEFGPDLSEIGSKKNAEELLESIVDPGAEIAYGYEAHAIELRSGEEVYGIITQETRDRITVKDIHSRLTTFSTKDVASHQRLRSSIMPHDLQRSMSLQDLVDLVEYLGSLSRARALQQRMNTEGDEK